MAVDTLFAELTTAELVKKLGVSRRWIAGVLGVVAVVGLVGGVALLLARDRETPAADAITATPSLPDGAQLIDTDGDGENDFIVYNGELTDIRPDNTVSTAWIAGISAIASAVVTGGVGVVVALLGRNDKQAFEELGRRIDEHTHTS